MTEAAWDLDVADDVQAYSTMDAAGLACSARPIERLDER